ncbi:hypothetical protein RR42_m2270 [Cupriavidus basilensis]|uniref:Uncharacterized protein n=1 Tax=Cupriavidus basilensis TaxID=68895 RepID=A0A0C4Y3B9_9BURK|nr:hypothetical protein RR42_m2270 [Cupriavidus basilensis]
MPDCMEMENAADTPDGANLEIVRPHGLHFNIEKQFFQF